MTKLPDNWQVVPLHSVAKIQTGLAKGKVYNAETVRLPYLRVANVQDGFLDLSEIKTIEILPSEIERYRLRYEDVLLTEGGDADKLGRGDVWKDQIPLCLHQNHIFVVRTHQEVLDPYFFSYQTSSPYGKAYFLASSKQSTNLASINSTQLKEFPVLLPPLPEQRKIAAILSTWDEAITLTEQLIAALKQRKQALMQLLLTGEVRFAEFAEDDWRTTSLGDIATIKRGASPRPINDPIWFADEGRAWVRIADLSAEPTRYLNQASQYLSELGVSHSVKIEVGELIMSIAATIGVPKIVNIPACIHDGFIVLRHYEEHTTQEFLYHYLSFLTQRLANSGQPGTQKNLNSELVREIDVPVLKLEEQKLIAEVLSQAEEEIYLMGLSVEYLQIQKRGLMQQLLTGVVRVQVEEV